MAFVALYPLTALLLISFISSNFAQQDSDLHDGISSLLEGSQRVKRQAERPDMTNNQPQVIKDNKVYYEADYQEGIIDQHWIELSDHSKHHLLSNSHGGYAPINQTFKFKFYGHRVKKVFLSTAGALSLSPSPTGMPANNYIVPLLSPFSPATDEKSNIYYDSRADMFIVEWRDVRLRHAPGYGSFTFQTMVHQNGVIKFLYKKLPTASQNYTDSLAKGIAGSLDIRVGGIPVAVYFKTARVSQSIREGAVVTFTPLLTCDMAFNEQDCTDIRYQTEFDCRWCEAEQICTYALKRLTKEWMRSQCAGESLCGTDPGPSTNTDTATLRGGAPPSGSDNGGISSGLLVVILVIVVAVLVIVGGIFYYAYTHPSSRSGIWLVEHHPKKWCGGDGENYKG